jgi:hypothetical protein
MTGFGASCPFLLVLVMGGLSWVLATALWPR